LASELVWTERLEEKFLASAEDRTPAQSFVRHYTELPQLPCFVFILFYRYGVSWNLLEKEWRCVEWRGIKIEHIRNLVEILQRNADESEREEKGRPKE
jgi:hypothetical protein